MPGDPSASVAPLLSRPSLTRGPPSPAEGGGTNLDPSWSPGGSLVLGITLFRPSPEQVERVLARAADAPVIAFDNGGLTDPDRQRLGQAGVTLLGTGDNLGIAAALNRIAAAAVAAGARDLLLLDQDADPSPALPAALRAALDRLRAAGLRIAAVGPAPAAAPGHKAPAYPPRPGAAHRGALAPVQFLATSGSLLDLAAFAAIGPFREDFFIDGVELDWCFRAWARGHGVYVVPDVAIPHRVGGGTIRAFGIAMPRQPLFRMATYLRNAVYAWRLPHVPLRWKLAQGAYLPLQAALYWADSGFRPGVLLRLLAAVRDGLVGRLGPPRDLP